MAVDLMSADAVSDGRLVRPFEHRGRRGRSAIGLWSPRVGATAEKLRAFRDWLKQEVPASVHGYVHQSRDNSGMAVEGDSTRW